MTDIEHSKEFLLWYAELQRLAEKSDSAWLLSSDAAAHFPAYQKGLSAEEEFTELDELAQWRSCGCGGS